MDEIRVPGARPISKRSWNARFWLDHIPDLYKTGTDISDRNTPEFLSNKEKVRNIIIRTQKHKSGLKPKQRKEETEKPRESPIHQLSLTLSQLWDESQISEENKKLFFACVDTLPNEKAVSVIDFELKQTRRRVSLLQQVNRAVSQREEIVSRLHYLDAYFAESPGLLSLKSEVLKCAETVSRLRLLSLQVVEGIEKWRSFLSSLLVLQPSGQAQSLVYIWEKGNYLVKMRMDLDFLAKSSLSAAIQFVESDPFLLLCGTCGSLPPEADSKGLIFFPSDTGKTLIPVSPTYQSRFRLCEIVVMSETDTSSAVPSILRMQGNSTNSTPGTPKRSSFSMVSARSASISAPFPTSLAVHPSLIIDCTLESFLQDYIFEEILDIAQESILFEQTETVKILAMRIGDGLLDGIFKYEARNVAKTVFSDVVKAKMLLHSSNILEEIIIEGIRDDIPRIAEEAITEETDKMMRVASERVAEELVWDVARLSVIEAMDETISTLLLDSYLTSLLLSDASSFLTAEKVGFHANSDLGNLLYDDLVLICIQDFASELQETLQVEEKPIFDFNNMIHVIANELIEEVLKDFRPEAQMILTQKKENARKKQDSVEQQTFAKVAKALILKVVDEFDYAALAEEEYLAEISQSTVLSPFQTSSLLSQLSTSILTRLIYSSLLENWSEGSWLQVLCSSQIQIERRILASQVPWIQTGKLRSEVIEKIDYTTENFTPLIHSPRNYASEESRRETERDRLETTESYQLDFADDNDLELFLVFGDEAELEPIEVLEEDLPKIIFLYVTMVRSPLNSTILSPEALFQIMKAAVNPQWYWIFIERKILGLACFSDDKTDENRLICEHFSCLDFRYFGFCLEEVIRWSLRQYQDLRVRLYSMLEIAPEIKAFFTAKKFHWKTTRMGDGLQCMEMGMGREEKNAISKERGVRFQCEITDVKDEGEAIEDSDPAEVCASGCFQYREMLRLKSTDAVLSDLDQELANFRYFSNVPISPDSVQNRVSLCGSLRICGSEVRLETFEGRMCRCLRVRSEESEVVLNAKTDLWFPNFVYDHCSIHDGTETLMKVTCLGEESTASVKIREKTGVVFRSDFLFGEGLCRSGVCLCGRYRGLCTHGCEGHAQGLG